MNSLHSILKEAKDVCKKADKHVCDLASGKKRWNMTIPPQKDDSDILLSDAIRLNSRLIKSLELALYYIEGDATYEALCENIKNILEGK